MCLGKSADHKGENREKNGLTSLGFDVIHAWIHENPKHCCMLDKHEVAPNFFPISFLFFFVHAFIETMGFSALGWTKTP